MTVTKIQKNLDDLERKVDKSNKIVSKGDKIGFADAIKLGSKSDSMVSTLKKATKEYEGVTPTTDESKAILKKMEALLVRTEAQLDLLVKHKDRFEALKVGGLLKRSLGKSSAASGELETVMLRKAPEELKPEAEHLAVRRKAAFAKATAAFDKSVGGEDQADVVDDSD